MPLTTEKLIEGLKSPDTSSLILPDLLSLSDPFSGSVEESGKGVCARQTHIDLTFFSWGRFHTVLLDDLVLTFLDLYAVDTKLCVAVSLRLNLLLVSLLPSRPSDCRRLPAWLLAHLCTVCRSGGGQRLLLSLLGSHFRSLRPG